MRNVQEVGVAPAARSCGDERSRPPLPRNCEQSSSSYAEEAAPGRALLGWHPFGLPDPLMPLNLPLNLRYTHVDPHDPSGLAFSLSKGEEAQREASKEAVRRSACLPLPRPSLPYSPSLSLSRARFSLASFICRHCAQSTLGS